MVESNIESDTDLCNMAIANLGSQKFIEDLETDKSPAARACRLFFNTALRATFRDFDWPFTTKFVTLTLVTERNENDEHPTDEWTFAYRYPSEALKFRRICSGVRNDDMKTRVPYKIIRDGQEISEQDASSGCLILTDEEDAKAELTVLREDVERYPDDFKLAFSRRLASYIAPMVTGGDPFKLQEKNLSLYAMDMKMARGNSGNEESVEELPDAEHITCR